MKRFIRTILLLGLLFVGGRYAYQQAAPYFQRTFGTTNPLPYVSYRIQDMISNRGNQQKGSDSDAGSGHTFNQAQANVYIDLTNTTLRSATMSAISAWNNTGAFNFKITNNQNDAQIIVKEMDDGTTNAAGLTTTRYNSLTGHLVKATVRLNSYYLLNPYYGYDNSRIVNTAEHELGHAIGLNHRHDVSVMYPQGSYYTIQPSDIQNVQKLYKQDQNSSSNQSSVSNAS